MSAWAGYVGRSETRRDVVPALAVRGVQWLQILAVVALVPAVVDLIGTLRRRAGARRVIAAELIVVGLAGLAWAAWTMRFLAVDIGV